LRLALSIIERRSHNIMAEIGAALNRLGNDASFVGLDPAQEQRVRDLVAELEAIHRQAKKQL
jgi:hypothetical protein